MDGSPRTGSIPMSLTRFLARGPIAVALALALAACGLVPSARSAEPAAKPSSSSSKTGEAPAKKLDLNAATEAQLLELPRVGPAMAQRILEYRKQVGTIRTLDELVNVKGIGEKTLEFLRPYITVAGASGSSKS